MTRYVKSVSATNIHGRFDLLQDFQPGINILHGRNGMGKTTLLHILANILNGEFSRFAFLKFDEISLEIADSEALFGTKLNLSRTGKDTDNEAIVISIDGAEVGEPISIAKVQASEKENSRDMRRRERLGKVEMSAPLLPTAYFPAFRTMIEAWSSFQEGDNVRQYLDYASALLESRMIRRRYDPEDVSTTLFARELFGQFVPRISYPSPIEIEQRIADEAQQAMLMIGKTDRELLTNVFLDVVRTLSQKDQQLKESPDAIIEQISTLSNELADYPTQGEVDRGVYPQLTKYLQSFEMSDTAEEQLVVRVLDVYRKSLEERVRVQNESFVGIETYLDSVNRFLEGKKLALAYQDTPRVSRAVLQFNDGSTSTVRTLSSGERQIITLIYAATHMSDQQVVLIDEPEISLHVDWQRDLLASMADQLGGRQIIACTHSPTIGANYDDRMFELVLKPTVNPSPDKDLAHSYRVDDEESEL